MTTLISVGHMEKQECIIGIVDGHRGVGHLAFPGAQMPDDLKGNPCVDEQAHVIKLFFLEQTRR